MGLAVTPGIDVADGPSYTCDAITPSDSVTFDPWYRAIYITNGGTLSFVDGRGATKSITVPSCFMLPVVVRKINATGTTASGILGFP